MSGYDGHFYDYVRASAASSAAVVVPLVLRLVHPRSVIDVGCGTGAWLAAFAAAGIDDYAGVEGEWVRGQKLDIPEDRLTTADLAKPFRSDRRYDLAVSLEVAEHLPAESAGTYVETLTALGPVVLFSAAIPGQGGRDHVNEQWPEYWAALFERRGCVAIDCLRREVWRDKRVAYYYAQNLLLFAERGWLQDKAELRHAAEASPGPPLALVHPGHAVRLARKSEAELRADLNDPAVLKRASLRRLLAALPGAFTGALRRRLGRPPISGSQAKPSSGSADKKEQ